MHHTILLGAVVPIALACGPLVPVALAQSRSDDLELRLRANTQEPIDASGVAVVVELVNPSSGSLACLLSPHILPEVRGSSDPYLRLSLVLRDSRNQRIWPNPPTAGIDIDTLEQMPPDTGLVALLSGEHFGRVISLTEGPFRHHRLSPGRYTLSARIRCNARSFVEALGSDSRARVLGGARLDDVCQREFESNVLELTVR
jgi:hypothetical protein